MFNIPCLLDEEYWHKLQTILVYRNLSKAAFFRMIIKEMLDYHYYLVQESLGIKEFTSDKEELSCKRNVRSGDGGI